jgi:hypothetical protein
VSLSDLGVFGVICVSHFVVRACCWHNWLVFFCRGCRLRYKLAILVVGGVVVFLRIIQIVGEVFADYRVSVAICNFVIPACGG